MRIVEEVKLGSIMSYFCVNCRTAAVNIEQGQNYCAACLHYFAGLIPDTLPSQDRNSPWTCPRCNCSNPPTEVTCQSCHFQNLDLVDLPPSISATAPPWDCECGCPFNTAERCMKCGRGKSEQLTGIQQKYWACGACCYEYNLEEAQACAKCTRLRNPAELSAPAVASPESIVCQFQPNEAVQSNSKPNKPSHEEARRVMKADASCCSLL